MKMQAFAGQTAGSLKYDLLTMLSIAGLHGTATQQTSMLRLIGLVTARYNWRLDELTVGQRDIAKMWAVNERTVKREMKRLTESKIILCKRQGVRGRVGAYRLNYSEIARRSEPAWADVGPDFAYRMADRYRTTEVRVVQLSSYARPSQQDASSPWGQAMKYLCKEHPDLYSAWFAKLGFVTCENRILRLSAPTRFLQQYVETHLLDILLDAVVTELGPISKVEFQM